MDEQVFSDQRVKDLIAEAFVPVRIDSAQDDKTFEEFGIEYIPTLIILDSAGNELSRTNSQTVDQLLATLNQYANN